MSLQLLDNPLINSTLFYPRRAEPGRNQRSGVLDGDIPVSDDVVLGYRLFAADPALPVVLFFHGNGEIAPDYDDIAPLFQRAGVSLLVVDFRGYGWSTGQPAVPTLLSDVDVVYEALPGLLEQADLTGKWFVMGRSLGSAPAIHLVHKYGYSFAGLILESGFAHIVPLMARLGLPTERLVGLPDPVGNVRKLAEVDLPLLVIHGERDSILPVENGQALYDASPASHKHILRIPRAGHNNLLFHAPDVYFNRMGRFIDEVLNQ
jgi:alpha-beta hydrolase superfamily lysophospholipase